MGCVAAPVSQPVHARGGSPGLAAPPPSGITGPMFAGFCATLLGVGLQRFAYAPLLPAMVHAQWLSAGEAGALGGVNLAGYLAGALAAPAIARRIGLIAALRLAMLGAILCFSLCAIQGGLLWFSPWRALAGFSGGLLMVLAGPAVQAAVPAGRRGFAAGIVFAGVGSGIMLGAALVPALLPWGLPAAWLALAFAALVLCVAAWRLWPDVPPPPRPPMTRAERAIPGAARLVAAYAFSAAAATAHMVWWPDFIARGLGHGTNAGAEFWFVYGMACAVGPLVYGRTADRIGPAAALFLVLGVQALALLLPLLDTGWLSLSVSSVMAGSAAAGSTAVTLTLARVLAGDRATGIWRLCTAAWGAAQTVTGFFFAWLFAQTGAHAPLFEAAVILGLISAALGWPARRNN